MAEVKKTNGHDPLTLRMVEVLERIEAEIKGLREETRGELTDLRGELHAFREETRAELREIHHAIADTNVRVTLTNDRLEEVRADHRRGAVETRLARLEEAVFRKAS